MSEDFKIYVDAAWPATLNNGAGVLIDCATLQEAVLAWHRSPTAQRYEPPLLAAASTTRTRLRGSTTVPSVANPCAMQIPNPISCSHRRCQRQGFPLAAGELNYIKGVGIKPFPLRDTRRSQKLGRSGGAV